MEFSDFESYFSSPRIERYLVACSFDKERCIKLYKSNLYISQAFHPLLGSLEVILRNGINDQLKRYFNNPDWILTEKTRFMVSPILLNHRNKRTGKLEKNRFLLNSVIKAENNIYQRGMEVTSGRVISEQTFGFWTDLYETHHYKILRGRPIKIFKYLPNGVGRSEVLSELNKVRQFRNRINHNEPICFVGNHINFSNTKAVYQSIITLLQWIDPELAVWFNDLDKVILTIENA